MHHKYPASSVRRQAQTSVRAFTVLEMMIVIAIIAMLVGLTVTNFDTLFGEARTKTAEMFVKSSIKVPLQRYSMGFGDYPSTAEGLQALITAPAGKEDRWKGPYLSENKIPLDPWKEPYQYRYPGTKSKGTYDIWSKGPDKQDGTEDDIGNWN